MELNNHLFTVSELNNLIKSVLESSFTQIYLEGEITNFRPASSGHWYFSLRDRDSLISGVMFKGSSFRVNFRPEDGMKVKVRGKLSLYTQRGSYQIICESMELFGEGDIILLIEERKKRFHSLGYFDPSKKRKILRFPSKIGIITSPTGAAIRDILQVITRRKSLSDIIIYPTLVQGLEAERSIKTQIEKANKMGLCDLLIVTRGGGSMEDLLPFSSEGVVEAIYNSKIPVISAVGHEIDTTLSDYAADVRVATPSAAGEVVTEGSLYLQTKLDSLKSEIASYAKQRVTHIRSKLNLFNIDTLLSYLQGRLNSYKLHLDSLEREIISSQKRVLNRDRNRLEVSKGTINSLSPVKLFDKGYAWASKDGKSLMNTKLSIGDSVLISYKNGKIESEVKSINEL